MSRTLEKFRPYDNDPSKAKSASGFNFNFDGRFHKIMVIYIVCILFYNVRVRIYYHKVGL